MKNHPFKNQRKEDKELLAFVSRLPCVVCIRYVDPAIFANEITRDWPVISDPDHLTTRGAGGGDTSDNVMPLCRMHHTERHMRGIKAMAEKYPSYKQWIMLSKREELLDE